MHIHGEWLYSTRMNPLILRKWSTNVHCVFMESNTWFIIIYHYHCCCHHHFITVVFVLIMPMPLMLWSINTTNALLWSVFNKRYVNVWFLHDIWSQQIHPRHAMNLLLTSYLKWKSPFCQTTECILTICCMTGCLTNEHTKQWFVRGRQCDDNANMFYRMSKLYLLCSGDIIPQLCIID